MNAFFPILLIVLLELPVTSNWIHEHFEITSEPVLLRYMILAGLELFIIWKIYVYSRYLSSETFKEHYFIGKTDEKASLTFSKTTPLQLI